MLFPSIATLAFSIQLVGFLRRKRGAGQHAALMSAGIIIDLSLVLALEFLRDAVATSAGVTVPVSLAGAAGYMLAGLPHQAAMPPLSLGFVSLIGFALMAPISTFVAGYGARLAHGLGKRQLEMAFGAYLLLMVLRFAATLI